METITKGAPSATVVPESRPFAWLQPASDGLLPASAVQGMQDLRIAVEDHAPELARALVAYTFRTGQELDLLSRRGPTTSILNRRRRSARLWINAILSGRWDDETLENLRRVWVPQLAGTGHYAHRAKAVARRFVEFLRGAMTAYVFDETAENLVPQARAVHALDSVLAVHLRAFGRLDG